MTRPDPDPSRDTERYERLVRSCAPRVYRAALSVLGRPEDAEDVAGEVYLRLLDGRLDVEGTDDPCAFLAAVAARAALQHRRGAGRRRQREDRFAMERRTPAPTPESRIDAREERAALRRELARLPDDLRLSVALRFEGGLTYADIGSALGCAEPTAHDRVRRGLDALKRALSSAGLVGLVASLEDRLRAAPAPTPPELERRLLELPTRAAAAAGSLAWLPVVLGVAAAGTVALAAPRWLGAVSDELVSSATPSAVTRAVEAPSTPPAHPVSAVVPEQDERRPAGTPPAPPEPPPAAVPTGWVSGRVLSDARFPIGGAAVVVVSAERAGKLPAYAHEGVTDANGLFRLPVEVPAQRGRHVVVMVRRLGYVAHRSGTVRVEAGAAAELGELVLQLPDGDAEGSYALTVTLVTPTGEVASGTRVQVDHLVRRPDAVVGDWSAWLSAGLVLRQADGRGNVDASGRVVLTGERLGAKAVRVRPSDPRWAMMDVPITVGAGASELVIPLVPTRSIEGRVRTPEGDVPDRLEAHLRWSKDPNVWTDVGIDTDGSFVARGLAPDVYELWVRPKGHAPWSVARRRVGPDEDRVELILKRADDPRDVGDHSGELHGRLVDAERRPVVWRGHQLEDWWFPADSSGDWERDILPNHLATPPVQRAAGWHDEDDPYEAPAPSEAFHLTDVAAGRHVIYLSVPGYALDVAGPFDLDEGELIAGLELTAREAASVEVTVLDPEGRRLDGAGVFVTGTGPYSDARVHEADVGYRAVDGRGYFDANRFHRTKRGAAAIERLPAGRSLRVAAVHPDHEAVVGAELVLAGGEAREVVLRFARGR